MAERQFVNCEKCGVLIDKRSNLDWAYNTHSRKHICSACFASSQNKNQYTSARVLFVMKCRTGPLPTERQIKSERGTGIFITVTASIILVICLCVLSSDPVLSIVFGIFGFIFLLLGIRSIKKANEMEELIEAKSKSKL